MTRKRVSRWELHAACDQIGADDGKDPLFDRPEGPTKVPNRKALQLCGQVARTLGSILAYECAEEMLRDLDVISVTPAPNSSRLLVSVSVPPDRDRAARGRVAEHLDRARAMLR